MPVTPEDIEAEHVKALDSLTRDQRAALARVQRAYQEAQFNHRRIEENLHRLFASEATQRNEAEVLHKGDLEADSHRATD